LPARPINDRGAPRKEVAGGGDVVVVSGKAPVERGRGVPDDQTPTVGIEIGIIGRNPEVDVDRGEVGVNRDSAEAIVVLESPRLQERIVAQNGRPVAADPRWGPPKRGLERIIGF